MTLTRIRPLLLSLALIGALSGCDRLQQLRDYFSGSSSSQAPVAIPGQGGQVNMLLPDFTQLVEREGPAVVNISANRMEDEEDSPFPFPIPEDDPFFEFFKRFVPPNGAPRQQQPRERESVSYGSGFILSEDGYLLTNAHVVAGASQVQVKLNDKREFKAKVIGVDKRTDVAVLKIDASGLPKVKIGAPATLKVGEWVAAIGAPFGFDNTVTAGIVSAKGRSLPDENYVPFIQTDVAINPGNSGGPLFNLRGEVVGINSQIYSRSGGFMGISFAIPIDIAVGVAEQLKTKGKVSRGQLGVHIQELSQELARSFGRPNAEGALIVNIEPNSAAAKAGVQVGDIVLAFDGHKVESSKDLPMLVGAKAPGSKAKLTLWRKGEEKTLEVVLSELASAERAPNSKPQQQAAPKMRFDKLGLELAELSREQRAEIGVNGGLLVEKVSGLAAKSGLAAGDVILAVNHSPAPDLKTFSGLVQQGDAVALLVRRGDSTLFLPLRLRE